MKNYMKMEISALSCNEGFARSAVAAFASALNPTLSELADIKTAVSEAVTNCIVHAYKNAQRTEDVILLECIAESGFCGEQDLKAQGLNEQGLNAQNINAQGLNEQGLNAECALHITVTDFGCGIENVTKALTPFYTTVKGDERSGMGFTIMQTFMTDFSVRSERGKGTTVTMSKRFSSLFGAKPPVGEDSAASDSLKEAVGV